VRQVDLDLVGIGSPGISIDAHTVTAPSTSAGPGKL